ncbi:MAG TPA: hypothetical protein VMV41_07445 [Cellulomonadaceae bacterium]|nr:hypothetical protein [Cellulomonadaceae bacterium]
MSAADRLDAIEREIQSAMMPLGARAGAKSMTAALRAVLTQHSPAATPYGHVCDECGGTYPCETVLLVDANLGGAS